MLKKIWNFLWKEDSFLSWVATAVIFFIIIKFILYPAAGWVFGTSLPMVAVITPSMEHKMNVNEAGQIFMCGQTFRERSSVDFDTWWSLCGDWYEDNANISKEDFKQFRFSNGLNVGDIVFARGMSPENIARGEVVIFQTQRPTPIIHRVIESYEENGVYYFKIKGDNNPDFDRSINEERVHQDQIIGVARTRLPYLGYLRIGLARLTGGF